VMCRLSLLLLYSFFVVRVRQLQQALVHAGVSPRLLPPSYGGAIYLHRQYYGCKYNCCEQERFSAVTMFCS
jgi:hypothetical protein